MVTDYMQKWNRKDCSLKCSRSGKRGSFSYKWCSVSLDLELLIKVILLTSIRTTTQCTHQHNTTQKIPAINSDHDNACKQAFIGIIHVDIHNYNSNKIHIIVQNSLTVCYGFVRHLVLFAVQMKQVKNCLVVPNLPLATIPHWTSHHKFRKHCAAHNKLLWCLRCCWCSCHFFGKPAPSCFKSAKCYFNYHLSSRQPIVESFLFRRQSWRKGIWFY